MNVQLTAVRAALRALEYTAPRLGSALAERLFFTPPRAPLGAAQRALLATARPFSVCVENARVAAWAWGHGPAVALVHGWGGLGGRLATAYVEPLVASGFSVVTFDAPGHGASDGKLSSMPQVARALRAVAEEAGSIYAVIAHSMGGSATTLAMAAGLTVERAVFIAPAANPARFAADFAKTLGLSAAALARMQRRSEERLRFRWDDLDVPQMAARLSVPLLVLHDRDDPTVPWHEGAAIAAAWPGAELISTAGLGHRDIVRDSHVVTKAVAFVRSEGVDAARPSAVTDEGAWVDTDLFDRDSRRARLFSI